MSAPAWHPLTHFSWRTPKCPCQYGSCGHCDNGEHAKCIEMRDPIEAARMAARPAMDWLIDSKGKGIAAVYLDRAGAHTWRCSCHLHGHGNALAQTSLDLFGEVTA